MKKEIEAVIERISTDLLADGSHVELINSTELGVVHVRLSGKCCTSQLSRLKTLLYVEQEVRRQVPGVVIVIEEKQSQAA